MDAMDIDPEIAAQMGFSSFGGAPKKRKLDADNAFTGADSASTQRAQTRPKDSATGSNSQPLGQTADRSSAKQPTVLKTDLAGTSDKPNLQALRQGIRNERGDMAYFLPSFLEDPWQGLR